MRLELHVCWSLDDGRNDKNHNNADRAGPRREAAWMVAETTFAMIASQTQKSNRLNVEKGKSEAEGESAICDEEG